MKFAILLVLHLITISCFTYAESKNWMNCAVPGESIIAKHVTISPTPVIRGRNMTMTITLENTNSITRGESNLKIYMLSPGGILLYNHDSPLSELLSGQLPIQPAGTVQLEHFIPLLTPVNLKYFGRLSLFDQDKREACIQFEFLIQDSN